MVCLWIFPNRICNKENLLFEISREFLEKNKNKGQECSVRIYRIQEMKDERGGSDLTSKNELRS